MVHSKIIFYLLQDGCRRIERHRERENPGSWKFSTPTFVGVEGLGPLANKGALDLGSALMS